MEWVVKFVQEQGFQGDHALFFQLAFYVKITGGLWHVVM